MTDLKDALPRPWRIDPDDRPDMHWNNHIICSSAPHLTICFMTHDNTKENLTGEANARLIVEAVNNYDRLRAELAEATELVRQWVGLFGTDTSQISHDSRAFLSRQEKPNE